MEVLKISKNNQINDEIREKEVRVVDDKGKMLGVLNIVDAQALADDKKLDLVNISPTANPPVCKILDYGKYRYEIQKRDKLAKKKQKTIQIKEIRLSTFIEEHDIQVKANTAIKFFKEENKVKVSLRFRGRERDHKAKGYEVMMHFADEVSEYATVDKKPKFEGRSLTMFLSPKNSK